MDIHEYIGVESSTYVDLKKNIVTYFNATGDGTISIKP